jgi:hypothetical protein
MKKTRFTEAQIVKVLKQQESVSKVSDLCRDLGIEDNILQLESQVLWRGSQ